MLSRAINIAKKIHGVEFQPQNVRICKNLVLPANAPATSAKEHFKDNNYYIFLEYVINHLQERFSKELTEILKITHLLSLNGRDLTTENANDLGPT